MSLVATKPETTLIWWNEDLTDFFKRYGLDIEELNNFLAQCIINIDSPESGSPLRVTIRTPGGIMEENPDPAGDRKTWLWRRKDFKGFLEQYDLAIGNLNKYLGQYGIVLHIEKTGDEPLYQSLDKTPGKIQNKNRARTRTRTAWIWWGGDCEICLEQCGLHNKKPEKEPPLHPNCDCILKTIEVNAWMFVQLTILLERGKRVVREINLILKDKNLSERDRELLLLVRKNLDGIMKDICEAGEVTDYLKNELEKALRDAEKQASRIKFELSLREANEAAGPEDSLDEDDWYSDKALDKADEFHKRLEDAAKEFGVPLRVVKAAFTDEYDDRELWDSIQDLYPRVITYIGDKGIDIGRINDFGLSNIDLDTASRLQKKYDIDIPADTDLEDYLCTDEGCARFTAAAIKKAEEELDNYTAGLPPEKKEIMDSLNKEEKDALSVAVYKRGPEAVKENIDGQLDIMVEKRSKQKYIHVLEGYKAWEYWNREEEKP